MSSFLQAPEKIAVLKEEPQLHSRICWWRRPVVRTVVIWLAAVLSVLIAWEGLARFLVCVTHPAQNGSSEFDSKLEVARSVSSRLPSIFFLGTSYTSRDVFPELLSARLQARGFRIQVYNLGSSGSWPLDELHLLEAAVRAGAHPVAVAYELVPIGSNVRAELGRTFSDNFKRSYQGSCLVSSQRGLSGQIDLFLKRNFYLVRYRSYLRDLLAGLPRALFASDDQSRWPPPPSDAVQHDTSLAGWAPAYRFVSGNSLKAAIATRLEMIRELTKMSDNAGGSFKFENLLPLRTFCRQHKIPMILVWLPVHPAYGKVYEEKLHMTGPAMKEALARSVQEYGAQLVDLHEDSDVTHFHDCDHLNATGALAVTERLANSLSTSPFDRLFRNNGTGGTK